jgi:uncharacterized protein (TIGR02145 family)
MMYIYSKPKEFIMDFKNWVKKLGQWALIGGAVWGCDQAERKYEAFVSDDYAYRTVVIGEQTWMAENLRRKAADTKCYKDDPKNCEIFGVLYTWEVANTVCPDGWHLPDDGEWSALVNYVGHSIAGTRLKSNTKHWKSGKGTDDFGFTMLPGGLYEWEGGFRDKHTVSGNWSATPGSYAGSAHFWYSKYDRPNMERTGFYTNVTWAYVRCVMD